jgi:hypothetical protein
MTRPPSLTPDVKAPCQKEWSGLSMVMTWPAHWLVTTTAIIIIQMTLIIVTETIFAIPGLIAARGKSETAKLSYVRIEDGGGDSKIDTSQIQRGEPSRLPLFKFERG